MPRRSVLLVKPLAAAGSGGRVGPDQAVASSANTARTVASISEVVSRRRRRGPGISAVAPLHWLRAAPDDAAGVGAAGPEGLPGLPGFAGLAPGLTGSPGVPSALGRVSMSPLSHAP